MTAPAKDNLIVLAVDIERTGATARELTFAIGASVVDANYAEVDSLLLAIWPENQVVWEERCWVQFWSKNQPILEKLKKVAAEQQKENKRFGRRELEAGMIRDLVAFIAKHQAAAAKKGQQLLVVADTCAFDFHWINSLIDNYLQGQYKPLPYRFDNADFSHVVNVSDERRGLLRGLDNDAVNAGQCWKVILDKHGVQLPEAFLQAAECKQHDHLPDNDAYTIAIKGQLQMQHLPALVRQAIVRDH